MMKGDGSYGPMGMVLYSGPGPLVEPTHLKDVLNWAFHFMCNADPIMSGSAIGWSGHHLSIRTLVLNLQVNAAILLVSRSWLLALRSSCQ
jgi:hypothetical protein